MQAQNPAYRFAAGFWSAGAGIDDPPGAAVEVVASALIVSGAVLQQLDNTARHDELRAACGRTQQGPTGPWSRWSSFNG